MIAAVILGLMIGGIGGWIHAGVPDPRWWRK